MDGQKTFNYIVGKQHNQKSNFMRDTDGDGVINGLDCKPHNPYKQGFIHNVKEKIKGKVTEVKEDYAKEKEYKAAAKEEEKRVYAQERAAYLKENARKKAKMRARSGVLGQTFKESFKHTTKPMSTSSRRKVTTYVKNKKGKGYTKKVSYKTNVSTSTPKKHRSIPSLNLMGANSDKNRDGIPDILGTKGKGGIPKFF